MQNPDSCSLWKLASLAFLLALPLPSLAAEATIQAKNGVSLLLRNDGVLLQLGGQSFTPAPLPAILPIQAKAVILTGVDSLPER